MWSVIWSHCQQSDSYINFVELYWCCYYLSITDNHGKIDHLQFLIKTEFLAWNDSPICVLNSMAQVS